MIDGPTHNFSNVGDKGVVFAARLLMIYFRFYFSHPEILTNRCLDYRAGRI